MIDAIIAATMVMCVMFGVRIEMVYCIEMKALERVSYLARASIDRKVPWLHLYYLLDKQPFGHKVFDLTRWRFKHFYPELDNVCPPADTPAQKR